jgi:hypothetical protein
LNIELAFDAVFKLVGLVVADAASVDWDEFCLDVSGFVVFTFDDDNAVVIVVFV